MPYSFNSSAPKIAVPDYAATGEALARANMQGMLAGKMISDAIGGIGGTLQDARDARFLQEVNKYTNNPLDLAQNLANGTIDQSGVSKATLSTVPSTQGVYASNWSTNRQTQESDYLNQQKIKYSSDIENYNNAMQTGNPALAHQIAQNAIQNGADSRIFTEDLSTSLQDLGLKQAELAIRQAAEGRNAADYQRTLDKSYIDSVLDEYERISNTSKSDLYSKLDANPIQELSKIQRIASGFGVPLNMSLLRMALTERAKSYPKGSVVNEAGNLDQKNNKMLEEYNLGNLTSFDQSTLTPSKKEDKSK